MIKACLSIFIIFFCMQAKAIQTLSLDEAIILSIRKNLNIRQARFQHTLQKFELELQRWQFKPHYHFEASRNTTTIFKANHNGTLTQNETGIQPSVSLTTPTGTRIILNGTNNSISHFRPSASLSIIQPLLRGFGRDIIDASLNNAIDYEKIARLNEKRTSEVTITRIIHAWLSNILIKKNHEIDKNSLKQAKQSLKQTKLLIKTGRIAASEAVTASANVASFKATLAHDKFLQNESRRQLLILIGLNPNTPIKLAKTNLKKLTERYHRPPKLKYALNAVLAKNVQYITDRITLNGIIHRNILLAKDQNRWKLDLSLNGTLGSNKNNSFNNLNNVNQTTNASLKLNIPIFDLEAKIALKRANIALNQAKAALINERWQLETDTRNALNNISSNENAIRLAKLAAHLQEKSRELSNKKYAAGLIDSLELQLADQQLKSAQQLEVNNQINYILALAELDLLLGNVFKTWDIKN